MTLPESQTLKTYFFIHTTPLVFNILHPFILHNYLLQN